MQFDDKVIVLTGVGREGQVGEVVARAFAEQGARVVVVDVEESEVRARADALRAAGFDAKSYACDLTDEAQVRALAQDVASLHPRGVDALINLAGGFAQTGPVAESRLDGWQRQFAINLTTSFLTTRAFLPLLRQTRGTVVFFASAAALPNAKVATMSAYAAAKSGVVVLMRAVAEEEREHGVRANALAPTSIRTSANITSMGDKMRYVEREEVANAVLFLCSPAASAVNGQVIVLG
ncbi:MAG: SDR family NAD(P)-dependent oxidoreductase [Gemmatimonadaceae bacterium]